MPTSALPSNSYNHGRLAGISYNDGTPNLGYTYDNLARLKTVTRGGVSHYIYTYDSTTLRLVAEEQNIDTFPRNLHRHYDSLGRPLSLNLATTGGTSQYTTGYGYDNAGRFLNVWHHPVLDTMTKAPTGSPTFTYGYTYTQANPGDVRVGATGGAGQEDFMPFTVTRNAAGSNPALVANLTYEGTRDALSKIENSAGGTVVSSYTYTVNPISQRTSVTTAGTAFAGTQADWTWGYDALGQVTSADHANTNAADRAYQYDMIGNREKTATGTLTLPGTANWISNPLNQYTTADGVALPTTPAPAPFDLDGNLTAGPVPGTNGNLPGVQAPANATEIQWDGENRLVSLKIGTTTYGYAYDHLSRMITRTESGGPLVPATSYIYDGWNCIVQYRGNRLLNTLIWGLDLSGTMQGAGGVGGLLGTRLSTGVDYFPTFDGNGNVSEYLGTDGAIAAHYEYDPFGRITVVTGPNAGTFAYRFSTKPRDPATGLYYYGYRWYDPETGRWVNRDPIEEEGGVNLYGFVGNSSTNIIDVLGANPSELPQMSYEEIMATGRRKSDVPWPNPLNYDSKDWSRFNRDVLKVAKNNGLLVDSANERTGLTTRYLSDRPPPRIRVPNANKGAAGVGDLAGPATNLPSSISGVVAEAHMWREIISRSLESTGIAIDIQRRCDEGWDSLKRSGPRWFNEGCPACCLYFDIMDNNAGLSLNDGRTYYPERSIYRHFYGFEPGECAIPGDIYAPKLIAIKQFLAKKGKILEGLHESLKPGQRLLFRGIQYGQTR